MHGDGVSARLNTKLAGLFIFSGVFSISVPDNRRELLVIGPGYLEIYLLCFLYLRCSYCEMYTDPQKKFRPRAEAELLAEIRACCEQGVEPRRVFLADGDALVLSMRRLRSILGEIRRSLPSVSRVSSYCLPSNLKN